MQKKDKEKVFGGDWSVEQLREFMNPTSHDGTDPDFIAVLQAYRYMVPATFASFAAQFKADGHNLAATNLEGVSMLAVIESHRNGKEYADIIRAELEA